MGMYTEVVLKINFTRRQIGDNNFKILDYMFNENTKLMTDDYKPSTEITIPDHPFFQCSRWDSVGNMSSYYHHPERISSWVTDASGDDVYLFARNDLKNYDNEIDKFFDWLNTLNCMYEGDFIGYSIYEEDSMPKIYNKIHYKGE